MKKALKIIIIILLVLLAILITLPFVLKGKIMSAAKNAANKNLNAKVEFSDISLSFIRNFPNVALTFEDLSIEGVGDFKSDTLVSVPDLSATINLMSVISGDRYEVKRVTIENAKVYLKVLADGKANWDIMKEDTTAVADTAIEESNFELALNKLTFTDGVIIFDDASLNTFVRAEGVNHTLRGDLSADSTELDTETDIDFLVVDYEGVRYLNKAKASLDSKIHADLVNYKFKFPDAALIVNELEILAKGYFAMLDEGYDMDIAFDAAKNDFKNFLSLVPAVYGKDFDKVTASGTLDLSGYVKGTYSETTIPAFGVNLDIANGRFKYPDLPGAVENVNIKAIVDNKTGDPDATVVDINKFHLEMLQNPVDAVIHVRTPVSDPYIDAVIKGKIDLSDVAKVYPLEKGDQLAGLLVADVAVKGNQSDAENQRFNEFNASGQVNVSNLKYKSASFKDVVSISKAVFDFSPANITMPEMKLTMGQNDISAVGKLTNYLAYFFDKGSLVGNLDLKSNYLNVNDFMGDDAQTASDTAKTELTVIEVPSNIDFQLNSTFNKVVYKELELTNASGVVKIKDQQLSLQNLKFNALEGQMVLNGVYSTKQPEKPDLTMAMNITNIDVQEAFKSFVTVKMLAPIAELTKGKVSTNLQFSSLLGSNMMPVPESFNGKGKLTSPSLVINNVSAFNKLASTLKIDQLKSWVINKINLSFEIIDGKVFVEPFKNKIGNIPVEISGWNSFDQKLEYVLDFEIPRSTFGGAANNVLNSLVSQANSKGANFSVGETVPVSVLIEGSVKNPTISTSLANIKSNFVGDVKETIQQKKEEVVTKAKEEVNKYLDEANLKAKKLIDDAQVKADNLVKAAEKSAQNIRHEANKQADNLVVEGKKKGMVGELAAGKAAERVRSEGDKRANDVVAQAQKQADELMATARQQADKLVSDAKSRTN